MRFLPVLAVSTLLGLQACKACGPDLPSNDSSADTSPDETGATGDSVAPPPCDAPEIEPNDAQGDATPLPMEATGCGAFTTSPDLDFWSFDLAADDWLAVRVDARALGSWADPALLLTDEDGNSTLMTDTEESADVDLVFPALAGAYTALVTETNAQSDDEHYGYEILATQVKEPVSWNLEEEEDNGSMSDATGLQDGDRVLAMLDVDDQDWFSVAVPAGKHAVTLDLDARSYGSAGDFQIAVYRGSSAADATRHDTIYTGEQGWEADPYVELSSAGDEILFLRVSEQASRSGRGYWYLLKVDLEGAR